MIWLLATQSWQHNLERLLAGKLAGNTIWRDYLLATQLATQSGETTAGNTAGNTIESSRDFDLEISNGMPAATINIPKNSYMHAICIMHAHVQSSDVVLMLFVVLGPAFLVGGVLAIREAAIATAVLKN